MVRFRPWSLSTTNAGFPKLGYLFGGPNIEGYCILGPILGPLILGNYQISPQHPDIEVSVRQAIGIAALGNSSPVNYLGHWTLQELHRFPWIASEKHSAMPR